MHSFARISARPEFERDLKKLNKRYPTLGALEDKAGDLINFVRFQLIPFHKLDQDNQSIVRVPATKIASPILYKARKFPCRSLKGRGALSGIRVIYGYYPDNDWVEFVEIYFKADQENHSQDRITSIYGS